MARVDLDRKSLGEAFMKCVQTSIEELCQVALTKDPKIVERDIIEYESHMRIFGLEKFNDICYISVITLYETPLHQEKDDPCGVLLLYVQEENAEKLFKVLIKGKDRDEEELCQESTAQLSQEIFDKLKKDVVSQGYANLLAGEPKNYMSNIEEGVYFPYNEETFQQVTCTLWKEKVVVAELVLAPAQHG